MAHSLLLLQSVDLKRISSTPNLAGYVLLYYVKKKDDSLPSACASVKMYFFTT